MKSRTFSFEAAGRATTVAQIARERLDLRNLPWSRFQLAKRRLTTPTFKHLA
jgi:hypothetical protein